MANSPYLFFSDTDFGEGCLSLNDFASGLLFPPVTDGLVALVDLSGDKAPVNDVTGAVLEVFGSPVRTGASARMSPSLGYYTLDVTGSLESTVISLLRPVSSSRGLAVSNYWKETIGGTEYIGGDSLTVTVGDIRTYAQRVPGASTPRSSEVAIIEQDASTFIAACAIIEDGASKTAYYRSGASQSSSPDGYAERVASDSQNYVIGASHDLTLFPGEVEVSAVAIYNKRITDSEIAAVANYLTEEWGPTVGAAD